jgi:hypothetical protein
MVTWSALGLIAAGLIGLALFLFGGMQIFGGMMSSAPAAGEEAQRSGCILAIIGIVVLVCVIVMALAK